MAIKLTRYVDIVSGVGAAAAVAQRELIGRIFSVNPLIPPHSVVEFDNSDEVGTYFGTTSEEYKRAAFYFGWISKNITKAPKIGFARWVQADSAAKIYGRVATYALGSFTAVTTGDLTLTLGGFTQHLTGINLSASASLAAVASAIQTAVRAYVAGGSAWTGATVTYDNTRRSFNLVSGVAGDDEIGVEAGTVVDVAGLLGWLTGAILADGADAETITACLSDSANESNNFGSFAFIPTFNTAQVTEAATWNDTQNVMFQYMVPVTAATASAISDAIVLLSGAAMTLVDRTTYPDEFDEQIPMIILAATDYTRRNAVQNYMFQIFSLTPKVKTDADADIYDALRVNYYGQTQSAGQLISFYQRGNLTGIPTDPVDQNTYANEQWLKDAASARIMTLLLALSRVSANTEGRSQLLATLNDVVDSALFNGTISVGKPMTPAQKLFITSATGNESAWYQVQTSGYWLDVVFVTYVESGVTKYKAVYTLVYSKDDVIRKVEGSDVLI